MNKLEVGQGLFVERGYPDPYRTSLRVTKIGRKWAECEEYVAGRWHHAGRIDMTTMNHEFMGRCYVSEADYEQHQAEIERHRLLTLLWYRFRSNIGLQYQLPEGLTDERLRQAWVLLGLPPLPTEAQ